MAYKNDSYLVIASKFGAASGDAKAMLWETYDQLRDLAVSGGNASGSSMGMAGSFLWNLASLIAPSSFMTAMGGTQSMNIPGTSYWTPTSGGNSVFTGSGSSFGISNLGTFPGFPSGAAPVQWGFGSSSSSYLNGGVLTGGASALSTASDIATMASAGAYGLGTATGFGFGNSWVLPTAGVVSGIGGIVTAAAPYMGVFGLPATVAGNLLQGTSSAALAAYQNTSGRIMSNADTILTNKVRNIETVCKMLDAQGDVIKKMLKDSVEGTSKQIQDM